MAEQNTTLKMVETKKKINKAVNRKFTPTQPIEKPFFLDEGSMEKFEKKFLMVMKVIVGLIYIPIVLAAGAVVGIEHGFLTGLKKAESMYSEFLK